jgi:hypothetical protein
MIICKFFVLLNRLSRILVVRIFREKLPWFLFRNLTTILSYRNSSNQDTIVFWELGGLTEIAMKDAMLARSMEISGKKTLTIICDGTPRACIRRGIENKQLVAEWGETCKGCTHEMETRLNRLGSSYLRTSELISRNEIDYFENLTQKIELKDALSFNYLGVTVGQLAFSSTVRYMKGLICERADISGEQEEIFRLYFFAALINTCIAHRTCNLPNVRQGVTSHGCYSDYGPFVQTFMNSNTDVIFWESGYQKNAHYFSRANSLDGIQLRGIDDHTFDLAHPESKEEITHKLQEYFKNRYMHGLGNDVVFQTAEKIGSNIRSSGRSRIYLFCHISWDSVFDNNKMLFETPHQWLFETIQFAISHIEFDWVIKIHPSEVSDSTQLKTSDFIASKFPYLPNHIKVMSENDRTNILSFLDEIDLAITIYGTVGLELASFGKRVLCAGDAHYSNKGFTWDPKNKREYFDYILSLNSASKVSEFQMDLAQKYAYLSFIRSPFYFWSDSKSRAHWSSPTMLEMLKILFGLDKEHRRLKRWVFKE